MSLRWRCAVYEPDTDEIINTISFGVVPEKTTKVKTLTIQNLEENPVYKIDYKHKNPDVSIVGPTEMRSMEKAPLLIRWDVSQKSLKLDEDFTFTAKMLKT